MKGQPVRLFDVFVLAPAMVVGGVRLMKHDRAKFLGGFLAASGVATAFLNWHNFQRMRELQRERGGDR